VADIREAIRLTATIQLVEASQLPEHAPIVVDQRKVE
jgi:hypothetical protein